MRIEDTEGMLLGKREMGKKHGVMVREIFKEE